MLASSVTVRGESFEHVDGTGRLRISGNETSTGLFYDAQPVALLWSDNQGSVGQMLIVAGSPNVADELAQMRRIAEGFLDPTAPLWSQIYPLLNLFAAGSYLLIERRARSDWALVEQHADSVATFYPMDDFVMTQPMRSLKAARVSEFVERVGAGDRPIAFCARGEHGWASFVVDGHHKLQAYAICKVPPRVLEIVRLGTPSLTTDEEQSFLTSSALRSEFTNARRRA